MKSIIVSIAAALASSGPALAATSAAPPADLALARDMLKEQIAINSVLPRGSTEAANALAVRLKIGGFADVQVLAPAGKPHKGNVVVRLKGTGKARPARRTASSP